MKHHKQQWNERYSAYPVDAEQAELWRQQTAGYPYPPACRMPVYAAQEASEQPGVRNPWIDNLPRRSARRGRKGGLVAFIVLLVVMAAVVAVYWNVIGPTERENGYYGDGDSFTLSSDEETTTIPRVEGNGAVLTVQSDHGETMTASEVFETVNPAVVSVIAAQGDGTAAVGTGVIFTEDGYFLTNAHVIEGGEECMVLLADGRKYEANLVGYDRDEDVAVLKIMDAEDLPVAVIGDSDALSPGDPVYAIGNPLGVELRGTLTDGIVSAINRDVEVDGRTMTLIQTNAALNEGNSGGPLINEYGQVVGLNTIKMSAGSGEVGVEGLGFAIPSRTVEYLANQILKYGKTMPTSLGITVAPLQSEGETVQGLMVYEVTEGSCSDKAGVRAGDIITAADGVSVSQTGDLLAVRRNHIPGDTMTLNILRGSEKLEIDVVLDAA